MKTFDQIMRTTMREKVASVRRSVARDAEPSGQPSNNSAALARNDKRAAAHVKWQNTRIQVIPDSVGSDPWAMIRDAGRSVAPRNAFEITEQDPEDEDRERSETELDEDLRAQIDAIMGRGTRRRSVRDRRSSAMDSGKCRECRLEDSGQRGDAKTEIRNAIARLQERLASL